jgi:hypothetical protein
LTQSEYDRSAQRNEFDVHSGPLQAGRKPQIHSNTQRDTNCPTGSCYKQVLQVEVTQDIDFSCTESTPDADLIAALRHPIAR